MSALDQIRASLDQLMGTGRDGENNKYKVRFDDPRVCKSFLLGCCPHETLSSTRMDLGECPKIHDLALKADYEMASASGRDYYYDIDAMEHLQNFINDCDKRTELAKRRLKETQEELSEEATQKAEAIHQLGEKIGTTLASAEDVGKLGNVEESLRLMEEVENLKKEKAAAEIEYRNSMPASSYQQQKLRVCEVCSAFLGIHDNDRRLADHFGGKLHLGFITIRQKLADLQARVQKNAAERRAQREAERESRRLEREEEDRMRREEMEKLRAEEEEANRERRSRSHRSRSRERRSRDRRSRSRSRERRRRRSRTRSRSRDRRRRRSRSRSRDHHRRRSRSRHRSRSRSRDRRRRSRSRSRHSHSRSKRSHRSRDRSRDRNRSRDKSRDKSREKSQERLKDKDESDPAPEAADGREAGTSGLEMAVGAAPAQD